uniref:Uncharacterized protein n=1 Tax=Arundo donax TaxID=35708 RepID=A0A0A9BDK1_ARUDO
MFCTLLRPTRCSLLCFKIPWKLLLRLAFSVKSISGIHIELLRKLESSIF